MQGQRKNGPEQKGLESIKIEKEKLLCKTNELEIG